MLLKPLRLLLSLAVLFMVFFQSYRLFFLLLEMGDTKASAKGFYFALTWGLRLDLVITSYLMIVPSLLLVAHHITKRGTKAIQTILKVYFVLAVLTITSIIASDIPYYHFYTERISSAIFLWFSTPDAMLDFVKGNLSYLPFFLGFIVFLYLGVKQFNKKVNHLTTSNNNSSLKRAFTGILVLGLLFVCMRGGIQSRPISSKDGAKNTVQFYNHLAVNPILYFSESLTVPDIDYMPYEKANAYSKTLFPNGEFSGFTPISRLVKGDSQTNELNVVLILVESLSSEMVGFAGGRKGVTNFLDSMA